MAKTGAPLGNSNALKHGRRSNRPGTVLARLGKKYSRAYGDVLYLRRQIQSLLGTNSSGLTLLQSAQDSVDLQD